MARTWLRIRVDLLGGRGEACVPSPGRVFLVGPSHSFELFAEAIDAAFARWDLSHLHNFELADRRLIGYPDDSFAPDLVWLDHAKLKVAKEVAPGDVFEYVFDLGSVEPRTAHIEMWTLSAPRTVDRGKTSGVELGQTHVKAAAVFHLCDGKVTRLAQYWDRDRALADLGLAE